MIDRLTSLKAELREEILTKKREIEEAEALLLKLSEPENRPGVDLSIVAIGDTARTCIEVWCRSNGKGPPVDLKEIAYPNGCSWGYSFVTDSQTYYSAGLELTGGIGMSKCGLREIEV